MAGLKAVQSGLQHGHVGKIGSVKEGERSADRQRGPDLPHDRIKGRVCSDRLGAIRIHGEVARLPSAHVQKAKVGVQRTFGCSGRAGGVDDVADRVIHRRWVVFRAGLPGRILVKGDCARQGRQLRQMRLGQKYLAAAVGQNACHPVNRHIHRYLDKGGARLVDADNGLDHRRIPAGCDADSIARRHAKGAQVVGDTIGAAVEFGIGGRQPSADQGDGVRRMLREMFDQLVGCAGGLGPSSRSGPAPSASRRARSFAETSGRSARVLSGRSAIPSRSERKQRL
jgi:hypothetical protein